MSEGITVLAGIRKLPLSKAERDLVETLAPSYEAMYEALDEIVADHRGIKVGQTMTMDPEMREMMDNGAKALRQARGES